MNWFMASNVACCVPTAVSPETCVLPAGVNVANAPGMPFMRLKEFTSALVTLRWLVLRPAALASGATALRLRKTLLAS